MGLKANDFSISGLPHGSVMGPLQFILYTSRRLIWSRIVCKSDDDSTLLASDHEPTDKAVLATSLNGDLIQIHVQCTLCCLLMNPDKTETLVASALSAAR